MSAQSKRDRKRLRKARGVFKATCQRAKRCEAGCVRGEPCARLPQHLRIEEDAYKPRQFDMFKPALMPEGYVILSLDPTGGVIPVREARPGVYDFTPAGLAHLTAAQRQLWAEWDDHHEAWNRRYDGIEGGLNLWPFALASKEELPGPSSAVTAECEVAA